jgi:hypothetical protein
VAKVVILLDQPPILLDRRIELVRQPAGQRS